MSDERIFFNPPALPHPAVLDAVERGIRDLSQEEAAANALVGIALNDGDLEFIERCCLQVGTQAESGNPLLGLAGLCLGHAARRFGHLSNQAIAMVSALAARAEADPSDVDDRALSGRDDVLQSVYGMLL